MHDIVGVEHADDLGVGRGMGERKPQRAGLEALQIVLAHELEALAKRAAMLLDRPPERRVGRVVDDDHALEVRIVEPRHRIERRLEHLRRLHVGRDVDRHLRRERHFRGERRRRDQPARLCGRTRPRRSPRCAPARSGSAAPAAASRARRRTPRRARSSGRSSRRTRWRTSRRRHARPRRASPPGPTWRRPGSGSAATAARRSAPRGRRASSDPDW